MRGRAADRFARALRVAGSTLFIGWDMALDVRFLRRTRGETLTVALAESEKSFELKEVSFVLMDLPSLGPRRSQVRRRRPARLMLR
jgi:hypothetical protein